MKYTSITKTKNWDGLVVIPFNINKEGIQLPEPWQKQTLPKTIFSGKKDTHFILSQQNTTLLLVGCGENPSYDVVRTCFRRVTSKNSHLIEKNIFILFPENWTNNLKEAALVGLQVGTYNLGHFKAKSEQEKDWSKTEVTMISDPKTSKDILERAEKIAAAQLEAMKLVDLPSNEVTPEYLGSWAQKAGKEHGFNVKVLDRKAATKENLHAFLSVAQGSHREPQFIIMQYKPKKATKHLGLVGKGVTFDTGGLNIKTQGMVHMKCDMGGAATVLATMQLLASLNVPVRVTAIVPCVENSIDNQSFLPSDVIQSYSGKTIEIIDTDAEGRLILADALAYLTKNFTPDSIIDFATLTGSSVMTFGSEYAALFTKDNNLSDLIQNQGRVINEKCWALPLDDAYAKEMESDIADIKNFHGKPYAGAITAAKFLEAFTQKHPSWAHIDIAGTAFGDSEFAKTKHGTAFGVHLMLKLMENFNYEQQI